MHLDMRRRLKDTIKLFREKGAISKKSALTLKQLGLASMFKLIVQSPIGEDLPFVQVGKKFYLDEKRAKELEDQGMAFPSSPFRKWAIHTSRVPRGYLRYQVLQLLKEQAMAGSEISARIEKDTEGRWKPSPGSLYPLLKALKNNGLVEELPPDDGLKRYRMTELGHTLLDESHEMTDRMLEKLQSGPFPFPPFLDIDSELQPLRSQFRDVFESTMVIVSELVENPNSEIAEQLKKIFQSTVDKLGKLEDRLESK
jgi:DNA-binding PadR family transcriptional regulator